MISKKGKGKEKVPLFVGLVIGFLSLVQNKSKKKGKKK